MASYDATFFDYLNSGAIQSAERLLPWLVTELKVTSVLDVGCGQGAWLSIWRKLGATVTIGVDGDYVNREHLLIPDECFLPRNLESRFDLGMRFDLVQSLEVAEHLPPQSAASFVSSLVKHGDLVLFSAAAKGQGGHNHINEQSYDYWRALFAHNGYLAIDYLRPLILRDHGIEPWYRYNTLLFASAHRFDALPHLIRSRRVPDNEKIRDLSPPLYRARKALVGLLPVPRMTRFAKIKERHAAKARTKDSTS